MEKKEIAEAMQHLLDAKKRLSDKELNQLLLLLRARFGEDRIVEDEIEFPIAQNVEQKTRDEIVREIFFFLASKNKIYPKS